MWKRLPARRALLFLAAAVLSAVISDWVIETAANLGLYGPAFADHDQRSVLATTTAGVVLAVAAIVVSLLERWRVLRGDSPQDWLVDAARDISRHWSWRAFPSTLAVAIAVRYAMESAELLRTSGHVAVGLGWLGGPVLIALALHALFCVLTVLVLVAVMQTVVRAFDAVVVAVATLIAVLLSAISPSGDFARRDPFRRVVHCRSLLGRRLGERAPPLALSV
jgi:hypothetical protein